MTEVPPPPPPPGAASGPPGASPPPPPPGVSSHVPPPPSGATGSVSASDGRPGGGVNKGLLIGIVAAIVAVLVLGAVLVLTDDDGDDASGPDPTTEISSGSTGGPTEDGVIPEPSEEPDGLGDDSELDDLAEDCFDGQMDACDDLYLAADSGSDYKRYGDTCAGRQEARTGVLCAVAFPS